MGVDRERLLRRLVHREFGQVEASSVHSISLHLGDKQDLVVDVLRGSYGRRVSCHLRRKGFVQIEGGISHWVQTMAASSDIAELDVVLFLQE